MAKKAKIVFDPFNPSSIENAIGRMNLETRKLEQKIDLLTRRMAEHGVDIAKNNILKFNAVFTAELLNSVHVENRGHGIYFIVSDSEHTAFVEFGTGQMGAEGSYPFAFPDGVSWNYNVGETIFEIEEGQYGWFYPALDGTWKFTQGMPSRPFMTETLYELEYIFRKVVKEVFNA